jgi:hypothetical protein
MQLKSFLKLVDDETKVFILEIQKLFEGIRRDDGSDYFLNHLLPVAVDVYLFAERKLYDRKDINLLVQIAIGHDLMEDIADEYWRQLNMSDTVREAITELTTIVSENEDRHEVMVQKMTHASDWAKIVKVFDRWNNIQSMAKANWTEERQRIYVEKGMDLLSAMYQNNGNSDIERLLLDHFVKFHIASKQLR